MVVGRCCTSWKDGYPDNAWANRHPHGPPSRLQEILPMAKKSRKKKARKKKSANHGKRPNS